MQRTFVTNLALLLLLNLLIKPFYVLGIEVQIQNAVGNAAYGEYFALFNFSFLLNIILDFGIIQFNNRNIAQNSQLLTKHFSSLVILKLSLAFIYILATLVIGLSIGYDHRLMKLLLVLGFNQFLISFVMYLRSNLSGLHLFKIDSLVSVLDRTFMIVIGALLVWGNLGFTQNENGRLDVMWFVYGQTIAYGLTAVIAFVLVSTKAEFLKLKWNYTFFRMILKQSLPFAVLVLLMTFYNRIDAVMLERLLPEEGAAQSGIYAQAYRLLDATNMIAVLFAGLLLPMFARMIKQRDSVEELVKLAFTLLFTPAIIVGVGCYNYSEELMSMLYKEETDQSMKVFGILMSCFIPISITYIFGTLLTANGNLKELNIMAACGIFVNITLNFILIPKYFAMGSAFSSLSTQAISALIQVILAQRIFRFRVNYLLLFKALIFVLGVIIINYFTKQLNYSWMMNFWIMVAGCVLWSLIIRLLNIRSMLHILKYG